MVVRILFLILCFVLFVNLVLICSGLIFNVNLYKKYSKQILNFFIGFILFVIASYVIMALISLK